MVQLLAEDEEEEARCTARHRSRISEKDKRISERQITPKMKVQTLLELFTVAQLSLAQR